MTRASKIWLILGIIVSFIALFFGFAKLIIVSAIEDAKNRANAFIKPMYYNLVAHRWSVKTFYQYACPQFIEEIQQGHHVQVLAQILKDYRSLGKITLYKGIGSFNVNFGYHPWIIAEVTITFEHGSMIITTGLKQVNGKWCLARMDGRKADDK